MADLGFAFNAHEYTPQESIEALPAGWYKGMLVESEVKPTSTGTGNYLKCVFQIIDGKYANRKVFVNINLNNPNPDAVRIGRQQLSGLGHATGIINTSDSSHWHNIPLNIKLKRREADGQYEASNELAAFKHISEEVKYADAAAMPPMNSAPRPPQTPPAPNYGSQPQQPAPQFAPQQPQQPQQQQQPAPQPWQQQPQQQPAPQQYPQQQPVPQQQPAQHNWQQPVTQQPWDQGQQQQPAQQQPQFAQQPPSMEPAPQQFQQQPWQQQPQQQQPPVQMQQAPEWANNSPHQAAQAQQQQQPVQQVPQQDLSATQNATPPWARQG